LSRPCVSVSDRIVLSHSFCFFTRLCVFFFFFQAEDGIRDATVTGVQTCALPIFEVTPLTVKSRKGETIIPRDETPGTCDVSKIATMKAAFNKDGTVTAASSSSISDGAAALVLMNAQTAASRGLKPLARVLAYASHAQEPEWFTTAPVGAIRKVLTQLGWKPHDADLYEI